MEPWKRLQTIPGDRRLPWRIILSMLKVESVTSGYVEGIDILTDVSLEIKEGIITGMIGPMEPGNLLF